MKCVFASLLLLSFGAVAAAQDDQINRLEALIKKLEQPPAVKPKSCASGCKCKNGYPCACSVDGGKCVCKKCNCVKRAEPQQPEPKVIERTRFKTWQEAADINNSTPLVIFSGVTPREVKGAIACINDQWPSGVYVAVSNGKDSFSRWKFTATSTDDELLSVTRKVVQPVVTQPANPFRPWEGGTQQFRSAPVFRSGGGSC